MRPVEPEGTGRALAGPFEQPVAIDLDPRDPRDSRDAYTAELAAKYRLLIGRLVLATCVDATHASCPDWL
jgi:hypothetical protein